jgi:hypothetical protein
MVASYIDSFGVGPGFFSATPAAALGAAFFCLRLGLGAASSRRCTLALTLTLTPIESAVLQLSTRIGFPAESYCYNSEAQPAEPRNYSSMILSVNPSVPFPRIARDRGSPVQHRTGYELI